MPTPEKRAKEPDRSSYVNLRCEKCPHIAPTLNEYREARAMHDAMTAQHGDDYDAPILRASLEQLNNAVGELAIITSACDGLQYYMHDGMSTDVPNCRSSIKPRNLPQIEQDF